jgi:hypothetical protein
MSRVLDSQPVGLELGSSCVRRVSTHVPLDPPFSNKKYKFMRFFEGILLILKINFKSYLLEKPLAVSKKNMMTSTTILAFTLSFLACLNKAAPYSDSTSTDLSITDCSQCYPHPVLATQWGACKKSAASTEKTCSALNLVCTSLSASQCPGTCASQNGVTTYGFRYLCPLTVDTIKAKALEDAQK